jgi:hypothetical protein
VTKRQWCECRRNVVYVSLSIQSSIETLSHSAVPTVGIVRLAMLILWNPTIEWK